MSCPLVRVRSRALGFFPIYPEQMLFRAGRLDLKATQVPSARPWVTADIGFIIHQTVDVWQNGYFHIWPLYMTTLPKADRHTEERKHMKGHDAEVSLWFSTYKGKLGKTLSDTHYLTYKSFILFVKILKERFHLLSLSFVQIQKKRYFMIIFFYVDNTGSSADKKK